MARAKVPAADPATPWWLMEGEEECPSCGGFYIYEMEFRCPACETTTCLHCRRRHDGRWVCVACIEPTKGDADGG